VKQQAEAARAAQAATAQAPTVTSK
jgi:hypothetical protein